ncbi:MAG: DUF937 domain-containing protein [Ruminococcaceae bacterium]|nr:DUF937 domain-containing protein [Oscillospiraceae bacterium]
MDITSLVNTLMSNDSVNGISQSTNISSQDTQNILNAALPALLNGAKAQSQNADTSASFANALLSHGQNDTSNLASFLQGVDLEDGGKIVGHLLGSNTNAVTEIAQKAGASSQSTGSVLAAVAPLLMSLLGQQSGSNNAGATSSAVGAVASSLLQNVDMGSLLTGLLGGTATSTTTTSNAKKKKKKNSGSLLGNLLSNLLKG